MTVMIMMMQREELRPSAAARLCYGWARDHRQHRGGAAHREHGDPNTSLDLLSLYPCNYIENGAGR